MSNEGNFLTYCIEQYKYDKKLTGKEVMELFKRYKVLEYIFSSCEALHTAKAKYITEDIDLYIKACQAVEDK
ncbi:MAG: DUF3791 domain-containing protein [Lachnospiraceae bacterium]|nr:DUF3791 domain-containing protein [Lachnospiraceae bacterium]